jgi:hypothetical protein
MCGIFGLVGHVERSLAERCLHTLAHRGPDGWGLWQGDGATLGHRRLQAAEHTFRRARRRVAAHTPAAETGNVTGAAGHRAQVRDAHPHVLGGHITATQLVHPGAEHLELPAAEGPALLAENDAFAAAEGNVGQGVLVGHALGQTQRILQGAAGVRVHPVPASARGRAQQRAVDGDDGAQARGRILADDHLLVAGFE